LAGPGADPVISLARRPSGLAHQKLSEWRSAGGDLLAGLRPEPVDAVVCCLGTTLRKVGGDRSAFIRVDKDLVLGLARWARANGVPSFAVVSAVGADARSVFFYNRVKGEMERELKAMGFPRLHIFQPSILTGPRREKRTAERIGIAAARLLAPLLPDRYKPMPHDVLARALLNCLGTPGGTHTYAAIVRLAAG
ncbi:MAG: semialdehyde dehydrogenase, partial [Flavobacteriales bacterium]